MKTEDQKLESESSGPNWSINPIFGRSYSYPMQMQMQMQMQGSVSLSMSMAMPMQLQMNGYFPNYQGTPISGITAAYSYLFELSYFWILKVFENTL